MLKSTPLENAYAVFPLHTVLFPGCKIVLRVFEHPYLRLVSDSTHQDKPFVISLIQGQGNEVGMNECHSVGCLARVIDFNQNQAGILDVTARAGSRVKIVSAFHEKDNLLRAELEALTEKELMEMPKHHASLTKILATLADKTPTIIDEKIENLSATEVSFYLSYFAPISSARKQKLLALQNTEERLAQLQDIFSQLLFSFTA